MVLFCPTSRTNLRCFEIRPRCPTTYRLLPILLMFIQRSLNTLTLLIFDTSSVILFSTLMSPAFHENPMPREPLLRFSLSLTLSFLPRFPFCLNAHPFSSLVISFQGERRTVPANATGHLSVSGEGFDASPIIARLKAESAQRVEKGSRGLARRTPRQYARF